MFMSYEFVFDGVSSEMYGLHVYDIGSTKQKASSFANKASIKETRLINRVQPLHFGVNYHESPLEFTLVFGAVDRAIDRYEMEEIALWLTGHSTYKWLQICQPDMDNRLFRCLITQLTPVHIGWLPHAFEATVRCDCPYAYSFPFVKQYQIKNETTIVFSNASTCHEYLKPVLTITPASGVTTFSIRNENDGGRTFALTNLPASGIKIAVDSQTGIIRELNFNTNLYGGFNMNFMRFVQGDNLLVVNGDGELLIEGRYLYNVAG